MSCLKLSRCRAEQKGCPVALAGNHLEAPRSLTGKASPSRAGRRSADANEAMSGGLVPRALNSVVLCPPAKSEYCLVV